MPEKHNSYLSNGLKEQLPLKEAASAVEKMNHTLHCSEGRELYKKRKQKI
ncbi:hypothetical protein [Mucilaginibacter pineti]|nr:hypothetical protein [Mucilaginibacter pineti]